MSEKQQRLVLSIIEFLNQSIADGTVKQDDREGLEVAVQCIGEAFGVDPSDQTQVGRLSIKPASLTSLFDLFLKTRERMAGTAPAPAPAASSSKVDKEAAEKEKEKGNKFVTTKKYDEAIEAYGRAIALNPSNAVYYSNRAAAYSFNGDHPSAIIDAEKAIEVDPKFVKAYSRLGHAQFSLGEFTEAASAFRRGLEIDPANANLKSSLQNAESRIDSSSTSMAEAEVSDRAAGVPGGGAPDLAGLANMFGGGGGGGGGAGGMPDLASIMSNPMLMQMAQNMMANGGMEELMRNPALQNMASRMQSGNMPSMADMMADPSIRDLAGKFGGGGAGAGGS